MSHVSFWLTSFHQQVLESLQCDSGLLQCFLELKILPIISVVIYSLFLVLVILRLYALRSQPRVIEGRNFQIAKLTCIATHGVLALAALVTERVLSALPGRLVLVASVLSVAVIPLVALLSYEEHSKNLAPSAILDVYLLLSFLAELLRANDTRFSRYDTQMRGLTAVTLAVKVLVLVLESTEKEKHIRSREERRSPEDYISIWKKAFFLWLNPFIRLGYNKVLTPGDLLPLDQELTTEHLKDKFQLAWERARWKESKYAIFRALFEALGSAATWPMVPRVLAIVFTFCQPLLLKRLLRYLQTPIDEVSHVEGQALIGAYALLYIGLAISTGQFQRGVFRYLTMVRGCLTSAVYQKTIDAKLGVTKEGAAVTLITTDVERAVMGLQKIHDVWAGAIEVILGAALLANELSWVFLVPLTIAICKYEPARYSLMVSMQIALIIEIVLSWGTIYLSGFIQERQLAWMKTSQKRVGA
ncbi:hypothetical protein MMC25_001135 [Agyrium rufum]|nr:hypothetical protein [Agyrium rufum]